MCLSGVQVDSDSVIISDKLDESPWARHFHNPPLVVFFFWLAFWGECCHLLCVCVWGGVFGFVVWGFFCCCSLGFCLVGFWVFLVGWGLGFGVFFKLVLVSILVIGP